MTSTAMITWKTNGVLLRNRQIHNIVGQISPSYVFGRHGLWPSLSNPGKSSATLLAGVKTEQVTLCDPILQVRTEA